MDITHKHEDDSPDATNVFLLSSVLEKMESSIPARKNVSEDFDLSDIDLQSLSDILSAQHEPESADVTQVMSSPVYFEG
ncbi:MAG: hypothetical protein ACWA5X_12245 [bacterium]